MYSYRRQDCIHLWEHKMFASDICNLQIAGTQGRKGRFRSYEDRLVPEDPHCQFVW